MNRIRATSKSSDEIINELFNSLNLPASEQNSQKSKLPSVVRDSLDSKDSCDEISHSEESNSDSTDQEIDKLLEKFTDITDKNIKVEDTSFEETHKDKKKKKKKLKKENSSKSKHKKKKKSHKSKNLSASESERENIKKRSLSPKAVNSDSDTSENLKKKKQKRSISRSRSRSPSSKRKSDSKYRHNRSRSRSISDSDKKFTSKRSVRGSSKSFSRSPSPKFKKDLKQNSTSPSKKGIKESLVSQSTTKSIQEKNSLASKLKLLENKLETKIDSNSPHKTEAVKTMSKGTDVQTGSTPSAVANSSNLNNSFESSDIKHEKNEGKSKPIVIKSLKESSVLQQAEEAQIKSNDDEKITEIKSETLENSKENSINNKESTTKQSEITKSDKSNDKENIKKVKEENKLGEENLLTAFKKARKESVNNEKEKKIDSKKYVGKSRSRSKSLTRSASKSGRHSRSRSRKRSRSLSKTKSKKRRTRSRSKSRDKYKKRSRSRDKFRKRSRSHSRTRRSTSRNRYRGGKRSRSRSGSRTRQYNKSRRSKRSTSKDRRKSPDCVDSLRDKATRKRLLEVARKNAVYLMKNNCLPPSIEKESVRATGKSVEELTSFCRQLVSKEYSDTEISDPSLSPDERESSFSSSRHHPFAVKDSKPIMMNIRNAPMLPVKTNAERLADTSKLREQFPVSSGSDHRTVESEWVPVEKDDSKEEKTVTVFPEASRLGNIDITTLVSTRLNAMRRLQDNPTDHDAMKALTSAQKDMQNWALSKQVPGQFTGSTGAKILSAEQLTSGYQAWARKDQFRATNPVTSHFGMKMLQKMGWNPGEGLGKNKEGQLEPLVLDVKMDKRGLAAHAEVTPRRAAIPLVRSLAGKHPVSALVEICLKRKWNPPEFEIVFDCGPDHKKNFMMKVHVNNQTYKSSIAASTKKIAKANAAAACLQALGLIPQNPKTPIKSTETLHTTAPATEGGTDGEASQPATEEGQAAAPVSEFPEEENQQAAVQYADNGTQDPMGQYAVDNSQAAQYGTDEAQAALVQYDADGNPIMTQYDAEGNPVLVQYDAEGNPVITPYAADGTLQQYGGEDAQAVQQYSTADPSTMQQYASDGTPAVPQYNNDTAAHAMTQYAADGTAVPQYSADGTQYAANSAEAMAQYNTNGTDAMAQYSTADAQAMAQYSQGQYQADGTQASHAQYANNMQGYQYTAEELQAYQQQQAQQQQQYDSSNSRAGGSYNFPQPPSSLIHGISDDPNAAAASTDSAASKRDSRTAAYENSNNASYANNSSYNQMQQYYGSSYQGSQY